VIPLSPYLISKDAREALPWSIGVHPGGVVDFLDL